MAVGDLALWEVRPGEGERQSSVAYWSPLPRGVGPIAVEYAIPRPAGVKHGPNWERHSFAHGMRRAAANDSEAQARLGRSHLSTRRVSCQERLGLQGESQAFSRRGGPGLPIR
jgi:hypothetical protein